MKSKFALPLGLVVFLVTGCPKGPQVTVWDVDQLQAIGGLAPEVVGAPRPELSDSHKALCFDGKSDGIFLPVNPIAGWPRFTIEILFKPEGGGPAEQRFLHIQDKEERRALIETRLIAGNWSLDTFLRASDVDKLTLLDLTRLQPTDRWYWAALVYDGSTQSHYVDGVKQLSGEVAFPAMGPGRISLGVRQNRIHWFKGCISQVRFSAQALPAAQLQRPE